MTYQWAVVDTLNSLVSYKIDGRLSDFMQAVSDTIPGIQYGITSSASAVPCVTAVFAYLPGDHVTMGQLKIGTVRNSRTGEPSTEFKVLSPHISNKKYATHSAEHTQVVSKNMEKAVTSARTYLRRPTPAHTAEIFSRTARRWQSKVQDTLRDERYKMERAIFSTSLSIYDKKPRHRLVSELSRLVDSDYMFGDATLRDELVAWIAVDKEYAATAFDGRMTFVGFTDTGVQGQVVDVVPLGKWGDTDGDVIRCARDDLPEDLAGKTAVLSLTEPGVWVPGVGCRRTARTFYVI